jgi:hypothetical protein
MAEGKLTSGSRAIGGLGSAGLPAYSSIGIQLTCAAAPCSNGVEASRR